MWIVRKLCELDEEFGEDNGFGDEFAGAGVVECASAFVVLEQGEYEVDC